MSTGITPRDYAMRLLPRDLKRPLTYDSTAAHELWPDPLLRSSQPSVARTMTFRPLIVENHKKKLSRSSNTISRSQMRKENKIQSGQSWETQKTHRDVKLSETSRKLASPHVRLVLPVVAALGKPHGCCAPWSSPPAGVSASNRQGYEEKPE